MNQDLQNKKCSSCKEIKLINEFQKDNHKLDKLSSSCKVCKNQRGRIHYLKNQERINERHKKYNAEHKSEAKQRHLDNKEHHNQQSRQWRLDHPVEIKKHRQEHHQKVKNDPILKLMGSQRCYLKHILKMAGVSKSQRTSKYLGCTPVELIQHLQSQFKNGMTIENHGQFGWHIDHIQPLSCFDLHDSEQLKIAFWYTNLQPLWWYDNLQKGSS
jgi:hypothetical protein